MCVCDNKIADSIGDCQVRFDNDVRLRVCLQKCRQKMGSSEVEFKDFLFFFKLVLVVLELILVVVIVVIVLVGIVPNVKASIVVEMIVFGSLVTGSSKLLERSRSLTDVLVVLGLLLLLLKFKGSRLLNAFQHSQSVLFVLLFHGAVGETDLWISILVRLE